MDIKGYKGKIGAIIVTIALITSVFVGYAVNVDKTNTTATEYDYVTDVSGLFTYDRTPTYVDYDVAKNYTGYSEYVQNIVTPTYTNSIMQPNYFFTSIIIPSTYTFPVDNISIYTDSYSFSTSIDGGRYWITSYSQEISDESGTIDKYYITSNTLNYRTTDNAWHYLPLPSVYYGSTDSRHPSSSGVTINYIQKIYGINPMYFNATSLIRYYDTSAHKVYDATSLIASGIATDVGNGIYSIGSGQRYTNETSVVGTSYYDPNNIFPSGAGSGITYSSTTQPNNYVIGSVQSSGNGASDLRTSSMITTTLPEGSYIPLNIYDMTLTPRLQSEYIEVNRSVTIQNYVASLNLPANTTVVRITFDQYFASNYVGFAKTTDYQTSFDSIEDPANDMTRLYNQPYYSLTGYNYDGRPSQTPDYLDTMKYQKNTITYDVVNNKITNLSWLTHLSTYQTNDVLLNGSDYALFFNTGNPMVYQIFWNNNTVTYNISSVMRTANVNYAHTYSTPTYLEVNNGVKIAASANYKLTRWSNSYSNGTINVVFHADESIQSYTNTLVLPTRDMITITHNSDTTTSVSFNNSTPINVGVWHTYLLTIDSQIGKITITPCDMWYNMVSVTPIAYTYEIGDIDTGDVGLSYIDWKYTASSWRLSIYTTKVFLDTYNAVMKDPAINISGHFTDMESQKLKLHSFALYGDSITINGATYYGGDDNAPIRTTGNIVINNVAYTMQNISVIYADNHTYLTLDDARKTFDLGATTDSTLSFDGHWYFTTALYEGKEVQKTNYDWNIGKFAISIPAMALLCVGLILLGWILVRRFAKVEMTAIDYMLIIGAIVIALVMAGGILK